MTFAQGLTVGHPGERLGHTPHGLWVVATFFEERFMTAEFERIWALGWDRIRRNERQHRG